jgi:methionyl-tRNA formyltransferase
MTKVVFMGTPAFAAPVLRALAEIYPVAGVVTQPDRPSGRGRKVADSAVKQLALQLNLPVIQPRRLTEPEAHHQLAAWAPDLIVVAAFGQILKPAVLALPAHGCVNVHASLLPRHRGAAPIAAAILAGDAETGVTLMQMGAGLDTGPILGARREAMRPEDTTATLGGRLAEIGAALLIEMLPAYLAGALVAQPQDETQATLAPQLKKEDGHLDFNRPAIELERQVRALTPWPGTHACWQGQALKILQAAVADDLAGEPGEVAAGARGPVVVCRPGGLALLEVQAAGKKPMPAAAFAHGARGFIGARLT